ncbi:ParB N-terminal domain-containing protein [Oscillochloris sp. ZM17-4]|uniref:ParB N-terminal domain-containing protein n=1 Tax=Oscillochloris sp. ZM17-4 TaxID=2866714 RepID=UPI001C72C96E|nr:ParB N-terminal domain-containing protein [Oscillochloris sp. ZM17-4]MBX0328348.1 ParB N-terminal domain-containing protein [Oscillochloris sp. ZM17-4]
MSRKPNAAASAADRLRTRLAKDLAPEALTAPPAPDAAAPPTSAESPEVAARQHFLGRVEELTAGRSVERIALTMIAPDLRPEMRQPRMLPLPDELLGEKTPAFYRELVAELRALGISLRERQIQPIVVYPGASARYPGARYLILVGQRRWTAATLVGMGTLDAIIVEPPSAVDRVRLQYCENEQREDFSDMERAWTIGQLRAAMGGDQVPMEEVAAQLGVKRARAYQLRRMLTLTPEQQRLAALLRLHETQLRTMLDALHRGQLTPEHVDTLLQRLAQIAAERAGQVEIQAELAEAQQTVGPRQSGIDAPTVARLVARAVATAAPKLDGAPDLPHPAPPWIAPFRASVTRMADDVERASVQLPQSAADERSALRADLIQLRAVIEQLLRAIDEASDA